jgi:type IV pilus assembly protein PilM
MLKSIDNVKDVLVGSESEAMDNDGVISVTFSLTCTFVNTSTLTEEEASQGAATSTNVTQAATTAATQAATTAATQAATTESTQAASVAAATQAATR